MHNLGTSLCLLALCQLAVVSSLKAGDCEGKTFKLLFICNNLFGLILNAYDVTLLYTYYLYIYLIIYVYMIMKVFYIHNQCSFDVPHRVYHLKETVHLQKNVKQIILKQILYLKCEE